MNSTDSGRRPSSSRAASPRGQILIVTALALPILLGATALALDAGYLFDYQRRMQTAADSAALAAAFELQRDSFPTQSAAVQTKLETVARADAVLNGFTYNATTLPITV